mgnify:CR=1 FL=1
MGKRRRVMKPVRYNAGNMNWYRIELNKLIREMNKDVRSRMVGILETHTVAINNDMANDAINPVEVIKNTFGLLAEKWIKRFSRRATELSREMVQKSVKSADIGLQSAMKQEGFAINLQWNDAMTQGVDAIVAENVSLIRSIPEKYFTEVEGMVYRSVSRGGDRKALVDEIRSNFSQREGITLRRAKLIANDQVRKATSRLSTIRHQSAGITEGIWIHSAGQNDPRHKHVKANGTRFKLSEGLPVGDKGQYVMPSEEINCSCTYRPLPPW